MSERSETLRVEAELYDLVHRGNPGDLRFYRAQCEGAASILELGCGSGRVLAALGGEGGGARRRVGLDRHAGLLALARQRDPAVAWLRGDMRAFAFAERFDRVLVPFGGLYCLLDEAELVACLRCVRAHLAEGGRLVFDVYTADVFHAEDRSEEEDLPGVEDGSGAEHPPSGKSETGKAGSGAEKGAGEDVHAEPEYVLSVEREGRVLDVFETSRWDRANQRLDVDYDYRDAEGRSVARVAVPQRYILRPQLEPLLAAASLELVALYDDPLAPGATTASSAAASSTELVRTRASRTAQVTAGEANAQVEPTSDESDWLGVIARAKA